MRRMMRMGNMLSPAEMIKRENVLRNLKDKAGVADQLLKMRGKVRNIIFIIIGLLIVAAIVVIVILVRNKAERDALLYKCVVKGSKNAKNSLVVSQRDSQGKAGPKRVLRTLNNMNKGLEFTYSVWLNIASLEYNKGKMKPVFYKSSKEALFSDFTESDYAPGVFVGKNSNKLHVVMKTGDGVVTAELTNIPIKKWFHFCLITRQSSMDVYINGQMVESKRFNAPPIQNYGNLFVNTHGGFDGSLADLKFYSYGITYDKMYKLMKDGPNTGSTCNPNDKPPYFHDKWWIFK